MDRNSLHLFNALGIPVRIHVSWIIIFVLITWSLAAGVFPEMYKDWPPALHWIVGAATSVLFFLSVLLHELAHSVVARRRGMAVRDIVLFIFGGVSEIQEEPASPGTEFLMAFVGPLTSFVLGAALGAVWYVTRGMSEPLAAMTLWLAQVNVMLAVFNLLPGFPLDGGRVLRAILWGASGNLEKATRWATRAGMLVAYAFIFLGIWRIFMPGGLVSGLWLIFIGWFLNSAAQASYSSAVVRRLLAGCKVREITNRDCALIPTDATVEQVVNQHILTEGRRCLPVVHDGQVIGLLTVHSVREVPRTQWGQTRAADAMVPMDQVRAITADADLWNALQQMTQEGVNQLAVTDEGRFIGLLARDAVMGFIKTRAEVGA